MEGEVVDNRIRASQASLSAVSRMKTRGSERDALFKRPRLFDDFIRYTLFFCGFASILTTIGIVVVLGTESLRFFTSREFVNTNKRLVEAAAAEDATLHVATSGQALEAGRVIRIGDEVMRIVEIVDPTTVIVERGVEGTQAVEHPVEGTIFLGSTITLGEFFTNPVWQPQASEFGIRPLLNATLMTSAIAMIVALPIGLGAAVYLSEYASPRVRATLKPILEILAGIPTVVFGYFALTFMTPVLRAIFGQETVQVYNMASAGLVMGIMIIPTISSMSEDALSAVPRSLREASYGLGATRLETTFRVLLPAALSGIIAAFIVGVSRAVGETMIVAIASGAGPRLTMNPFEAAETITGHIARISTGDLSFNSVDYNSLFALGLTLFLFTLALNIVAGYLTRRFREAYQ